MRAIDSALLVGMAGIVIGFIVNRTFDILHQELGELSSKSPAGVGWADDVQAIRIAARLLEHAAYDQRGFLTVEQANRLIQMASELEGLVQLRSKDHILCGQVA